MGRTYREFLNERLQDPKFKKEWDELEPEYQLIRALINARDEKNISQRQLSEITGITQADISKMESGEANPTLNTLKRVAQGLGMRLELSFKPLVGIEKL
ncbi:MAG: helix-turn-helix transcriptional regulator [Lachnospiraceae bacterium]|nr:helix-turn-helix transcriptional regulator [Lachnospiraceae bacterium]